MVLQRLSEQRRVHATAWSASAVCLLLVAACGGGKSAAEKSKEAAAEATAACDVFVHFRPPAGSGANSQLDQVKASYGAFLEASDRARRAADEDSRWQALATAAEREAAAFQVIVKASTNGVAPGGTAAVQRAVTETKTARAQFIAQCAKADPKNFKDLATATPSPSPTATGPAKQT